MLFFHQTLFDAELPLEIAGTEITGGRWGECVWGVAVGVGWGVTIPNAALSPRE